MIRKLWSERINDSFNKPSISRVKIKIKSRSSLLTDFLSSPALKNCCGDSTHKLNKITSLLLRLTLRSGVNQGLTIVLVLGCPRVLVLPKEKPVFGVVVAWPNGLLKRLVVCWFCWPKRPPGFVPNPVVPFRKKKKKKETNKKRIKNGTLTQVIQQNHLSFNYCYLN